MLRYPSSNDYGIPDLRMQPHMGHPPLPTPFCIWGSAARRSAMTGTYAFYTDDYRFERLWREPEAPLQTGCVAVVEPNFSVFAEDPLVTALWQTYRKRQLAAHWQAAGLVVWVDLHVGEGWEATNLIGVPRGWQRWSTAVAAAELPTLGDTVALVTDHAEARPSTLVVYGGGAAANQACRAESTSAVSVLHVAHRRAATPRPGQGTRHGGRLHPGPPVPSNQGESNG